MPGEDGISLIRKVRALPKAEGGQTRPVALTPMRAGKTAASMRAGFDMHLQNPSSRPLPWRPSPKSPLGWTTGGFRDSPQQQVARKGCEPPFNCQVRDAGIDGNNGARLTAAL
jgi:CheY-like chemotaxis protein